MLKKVSSIIRKHKISTILIVVVIVVSGYQVYKNTTVAEGSISYVTAKVEKGTLVKSISGSGQVSASEEITITPKLSGDIVMVNIINGQVVKSGDLLIKLDTRDATRDVRVAETDLETAQLELEELLTPLDELDLLQAEHAVNTAKRSLDKTRDDYEQIKIDSAQTLTGAYEDAYSEISDTFLDLPDFMEDLQSVLGNEDMPEENIDDYELVLGDDSVFIKLVLDRYNQADEEFVDVFIRFQEVERNDPRSTIYALLSDTLEISKTVSRALESARNMYDAILAESYEKLSIASTVNTLRPRIQSDITSINSLLSSLQTKKDTIDDTIQETPIDLKNAKNAIAAAQEDLAEKELSLIDFKKGVDDLDKRAQEIEVRQKQDALTSARQALADHFVYAPFAGIIAEVNIKKSESVSASTNLATLITDQQLAIISLNEIDIAQVTLDQKATLTFDAFVDIIVTGQVVEIATVGTVTQGVVNYDVTIGIDIQDERVRPGMSISADVITEVAAGVLLVPSAAVKSQGNAQYVEILENGQPRRRIVELGSSNDTMTVIISGLEEGQTVITQTIVVNGSSEASTPSPGGTNSILPTGRGFGGGNFRR